MDHTRNLTLVFALYGNTIPVVSHGNDRILKVGPVFAVHHFVKLRMDAVGGKFHAPADGFKLGTRIVCNIPLFRKDASVYLFCRGLYGLKEIEIIVQGIGFFLFPLLCTPGFYAMYVVKK